MLKTILSSKYIEIFAISLICVTGVCGQQLNSNSGAGKLAGQIHNTCGEEIKKAVILVKGDSFKHKLKTNEQGNFVTTLPTENYVIYITKYGFKQTIVNDVQVSKGSTKVININIEEGYASDDPKAKPWRCPPLRN